MRPEDESLLQELRGVLAQVDPVPAHVLEAARAVFDMRELDEELAALVADSATALGGMAVVRAQLSRRLLSFEASDTGVELELSPVGPAFDLQGQVLGGVQGPVALERETGVTELEADALGRFTASRVAPGRARLRWVDAAGRRTGTEWFDI